MEAQPTQPEDAPKRRGILHGRTGRRASKWMTVELAGSDKWEQTHCEWELG